MTFTRWLVDDLRFIATFDSVQLGSGSDKVMWKLSSNGHFTVKSVYKALTNNDSGHYHKSVCLLKLPGTKSMFPIPYNARTYNILFGN